jgi:BMFP domain-containing protein YqiC
MPCAPKRCYTGQQETDVDHHKIEDIARRLFESIPPSLRAAQQDLETNFRSVLRATLSRLDLTTREEFDAQTRVLARTRELVEQLEARVAELESQLKGQR